MTCNGSGNPKPNFIWFKESNKRNILSRTHIYVIEDVVHNNNGVYICEATNLIDGKEYRQTNSVDICIGELIMAFLCIDVVYSVLGYMVDV